MRSKGHLERRVSRGLMLGSGSCHMEKGGADKVRVDEDAVGQGDVIAVMMSGGRGLW